jgi:formylglycine-generating enzyme required for sulfatase activity
MKKIIILLSLSLGLSLAVFSQAQSVISSPTPAPKPIEPEMVYIPGGTFTMGCTDEQGNDCYDREKPAHKVTVTGYYIGKYEVTQAQWKSVMGGNPSFFKGDNLPVEQVSWDDIQTFIRKLNASTGKRYRLPTEAEWEYAARGGAGSRGYKYSGSNTPGDVAWYNKNSGDKTHPVGSKSPNESGLYDMTGNVYEWCSDWYGDYGSASQTDPQDASTNSDRVIRGGSWSYLAWFCRVSLRDYGSPNDRHYSIGFRLACSSKQFEEVMDRAMADSIATVPAPALKPIEPEMVYIPGGTFTMGCTDEQGNDCYDDEKPGHKVTLGGYYIGKYEVTQAEWKSVMGGNPSLWQGDNLPVEYVHLGRCSIIYPQAQRLYRQALSPAYRSRMGICRTGRRRQPGI